MALESDRPGQKSGVQLDGQVLLGKGFVNGGQLVVVAASDRALALEVDNHCTLFRLKGVVAASGHQTLNDVVEGVVVVVEQHNVPFIVKQHIGQDVFLGLCLSAAYGVFHHDLFVLQR